MAISVREADNLLGLHVRPLPAVTCPLEQAVGEVLAQDIIADRPMPPYDRVAMDGIAVRFAALQTGTRSFAIVGEQRAGQPAGTLSEPHGCVEVMTGAVLPGGADCVVPVEQLEITAGEARLLASAAAQPAANVHGRGSDRPAGAVLVERGTRLTAAHIGIAAAVGLPMLRVIRRPTVAIVSTGDELVGVDEMPADHQVRRSNGSAIRAALASRGFCDVTEAHVHDDEAALRGVLGALLAEKDVVILSGGVSAGRFDFVPGILAELGVTRRFHGIRQRPGKPLWFGTQPDGRPVFGLPGNPVSALVCTYRYVLPALARACGTAAVGADAAHRPGAACAVLAEAMPTPRPDVTLFVSVNAEWNDGRFLARHVAGNGSGDFCSLAGAVGFVEVDADTAAAGCVVPFHDWRT